MKQDETLQNGLETLERILGTGSSEETSEFKTQCDGKAPKQLEAGKEAEGPSGKRHAPIFMYLTMVFGTAFLVLLLAYLIQARNSVRTIDGMLEENQELRTELQSLKDDYLELSKKENEYREMCAQEIEKGRQQISQTEVALELFYLENLMREEQYAEAATLFNAITSANSMYQYKNSVLDGIYEGASDLTVEDRLQEIAGQLAAQGHMVGGRKWNSGTATINIGIATIQSPEENPSG